MKVTNLGWGVPILSNTTQGGNLVIPGTSDSPSGQVPTANGSNGVAWGSNVAVIFSNSSNALLGPYVNFISGTGIAFAASSNSLTITNTGVPGPPGAGGGSSTDATIPSGGTLYDGTSTSGWTNFGTLTTFNANSTVPNCFYCQKTSAGANNLYGVYRATSSFPRTYTMRINGAEDYANYQGVVLLFGEAGGAGKYVTWGWLRDGTQRYFQRYLWNSPSSSGGAVNYGSGVMGQYPMWLKVIVTSATSYEYKVSMDGYLFHSWVSAYDPAFTAAIFGFGLYTFNVIDHQINIDWIHET